MTHTCQSCLSVCLSAISVHPITTHTLTPKEEDPPHVLLGHKAWYPVETHHEHVQQGGVRGQYYDGCLPGAGRPTLVVDPVETKAEQKDSRHQWTEGVGINPGGGKGDGKKMDRFKSLVLVAQL